MAALETSYDPETNADFMTDDLDTRLNKVDETLRVLTKFYKENVHKKTNEKNRNQLKKIKQAILTIRKGREDMIDAANLIRNTMKLDLIQSITVHNSPLSDISPMENSPESKSRSKSKSKTKKLLSKLMSRSRSKQSKPLSKKGGYKNGKTQKKKRI